MRWTPGGTSPDIEDRRSQSGGGFGPGGGWGLGGPILGGGGIGGRHIGLGTLLLLLLLSYVFRHTLFNSPSTAPPQAVSPYGSASREAGEERTVQLISFVLDDVQKTWDRVLPQVAGVPYRHAKLVLFRDYTPSACGVAESATGPFYCPADEKVYLDLGFFDELANGLGAPGEFGQAYVIAHEIGHHVQKLVGIQQRVSRLRRSYPSAANPLSVRLELQADCLAAFHRAAGHRGSSGYRGGHGGGGGGRGRPAAEDGQRIRQSRVIHARIFRRAFGLVWPGTQLWRDLLVQYIWK